MSQALKVLEDLAINNDITGLIAKKEADLNDMTGKDIVSLVERENEKDILKSALRIKKVTGQIHVIIHAWGILLSLPYILDKDEKITSLSLGAGNTGKKFDLETDKRIAEFKFIEWQGGPEAMRKKALFKDFFYLAEDDGNKKRCLYLLNTDIPNIFFHSETAIKNLVNRNRKLSDDFYGKYKNRYKVVSEYYLANKDKVEIINLRNVVLDLKTE